MYLCVVLNLLFSSYISGTLLLFILIFIKKPSLLNQFSKKFYLETIARCMSSLSIIIGELNYVNEKAPVLSLPHLRSFCLKFFLINNENLNQLFYFLILKTLKCRYLRVSYQFYRTIFCNNLLSQTALFTSDIIIKFCRDRVVSYRHLMIYTPFLL